MTRGTTEGYVGGKSQTVKERMKIGAEIRQGTVKKGGKTVSREKGTHMKKPWGGVTGWKLV